MLIENELKFEETDECLTVIFDHAEVYRVVCEKLIKLFKSKNDHVKAFWQNGQKSLCIYGSKEFKAEVKERVMKAFIKFAEVTNPSHVFVDFKRVSVPNCFYYGFP